MRLLIDNAISPRVARELNDAEFDTVHVRDVGLASATDEQIIEFAADERRTIVSADTDFGTLLALRASAHPSFVLLRGDIERSPERQVALLTKHLAQLSDEIERGAVIVISGDRIRVRSLPIDRSPD